MDDEYTTIHGISRSETYVKKSRFIALATSINTEQDAANFLHNVKLEFSDATHYCYAFSIGSGVKKLIRSSDAGEPANSAGKPILSAIGYSGFNNVICVVVRYFGGIKLGVGGLIRAYGQTAKDCLKNAEPIVRVLSYDLEVEIPQNYIGNVINLISRLKGKILSMSHGNNALALVRIRSSSVPEFRELARSISNNIRIEIKG